MVYELTLGVLGYKLASTKLFEGQLSLVSLLLHVYNHCTQQSTLYLFIPWSGLPVAMTQGAFWAIEDEIVYFILFFWKVPVCIFLGCISAFRKILK